MSKFNIEQFKQDWPSKNSLPAIIDHIIKNKKTNITEILGVALKTTKSGKKKAKTRRETIKTLKRFVIYGFITIEPNSDTITFNEEFVPLNQK